MLYGIPVDSMQVVQAVIRSNENLSEILARYNVPAALVYKIGQLPRDLFDVRKLQAQRPYTVIHRGDSLQTAEAFVYHPNPIEYVKIHFSDSLHVERGQHPVDTIRHSLSGVIQSSLYVAVTEAGGTPQLVSELADVYAWAIDFFGLQVGDQFKVIYTTYEVQGEQAGFGMIEAASFTHMGAEKLAFRYDQGEGAEFFDEQGNSLRKTFLKAPLQYSRISSHFSNSRLHPILKIRRPHHGVDYAAPLGTPVHAVGDGVVTKANYSGGGGKQIHIRHNSNYETAYLHLHNFAPGIQAGSHVKQGQLIGFVGSTGLSTGPHLDFRFYKNGTPVDPLRVDPPSAEPICLEHEATFMAHAAHWRERLDALHLHSALASR
ncbi:MAG: peptidoglycan DD-metalloendopeptidase family protein [Bacteroidia bacterium]